MRQVFLLLTIILFVKTEIGGQMQIGVDEVIRVDVRRSYSTKKELILQDFMDVEYIPLETNNDFLVQGSVEDVGKNFIIVRNNIHDGNIFIFDRNGKAVHRINRMGQGPGEYHAWSLTGGIKLDEDNNELFINSDGTQSIIVYDLSGNFKRNMKNKERSDVLFKSQLTKSFYWNIFNYDKNNLICYDFFNKGIAFDLVSKQNGEVTKEIHIPFKEKLFLRHRDATANPGIFTQPLLPYNGNWLLLEISSDTIFTLYPDHSLRPFIVRNPPIQTMDPKVFLVLRVMSNRYYFMETAMISTVNDYPRKFFAYDTQEKSFLGYTVYNGDYTTKKELYMNRFIPVGQDGVYWQRLWAHQLVEDYKKGILKGKLKEIAATLDEEDNPVIMLIKPKK